MGEIANYFFQHTVVSRYSTVQNSSSGICMNSKHARGAGCIRAAGSEQGLPGKVCARHRLQYYIRKKEHRGHLRCSTAGSWRQSMKRRPSSHSARPRICPKVVGDRVPRVEERTPRRQCKPSTSSLRLIRPTGGSSIRVRTRRPNDRLRFEQLPRVAWRLEPTGTLDHRTEIDVRIDLPSARPAVRSSEST